MSELSELWSCETEGAGGVLAVSQEATPRGGAMSVRFDTWLEAREYAIVRANALHLPHGIEYVKEYGKPGYNVKLIAPKGKRYGYELRIEVVEPGDLI